MKPRRRRKTCAGKAQHPFPEGYAEDGVDVTLIRWMLSLTPAERLDVLQRSIWSILELRAERNKV